MQWFAFAGGRGTLLSVCPVPVTLVDAARPVALARNFAHSVRYFIMPQHSTLQVRKCQRIYTQLHPAFAEVTNSLTPSSDMFVGAKIPDGTASFSAQGRQRLDSKWMLLHASAEHNLTFFPPQLHRTGYPYRGPQDRSIHDQEMPLHQVPVQAIGQCVSSPGLIRWIWIILMPS